MSAASSVAQSLAHDVAHRGFHDDPAQRRIAALLDDLLARLRTPPPRRLFGLRRKRRPVTGLYIWGGVGRGKTYLMDRFFALAPGDRKLRQHFHRFMRSVHDELRTLRHRSDPLEHVAERIAARAQLICFDEFFVSDIADAMLLGRLFERLFKRGVVLVATSNVAPDELYKDGLQRSRFLPAIAQLKRHTRVIEAGSGADYRLEVLRSGRIYFAPLNEQARAGLNDCFRKLARGTAATAGTIDIAERTIAYRGRADSAAWFEFSELCDGPRGIDDYIELARTFQTVIISDVPLLDADSDDQARRFIALVDEFYDRRVKMIVSAQATPDRLYTGRRLKFEFQRTASRLREMQGDAYLASSHRP